MKPVNINHKLDLINDHWNPRVVAEPNGQQIRLVKILGDFPFHIHEGEDETFFVVKGVLRLDFENHSEIVNENEFLVVPGGVSHRPYAKEEVELMVFTTNKNVNTGQLDLDRTLDPDNLERI
ncbi:MAG: cupin domain-containing protein [Candidatus Delongbacteria bacterium]|nr:cupin domain-containing protein [Candidatus Delongbacteria bacterium]